MGKRGKTCEPHVPCQVEQRAADRAAKLQEQREVGFSLWKRVQSMDFLRSKRIQHDTALSHQQKSRDFAEDPQD